MYYYRTMTKDVDGDTSGPGNRRRSRSRGSVRIVALAHQIIVRPMEENDVGDVTLLCAQLGYPSTSGQVLIRMKLLMKDMDHRMFVAETATGRVVGWVHVQGRRSLIADPFAQVSGLVTDEGHRGEGVGRALMEAAEKWARGQGYSEVLLYTNIVRAHAHRFYLQMGYVTDKTSRVFHKKL